MVYYVSNLHFKMHTRNSTLDYIQKFTSLSVFSKALKVSNTGLFNKSSNILSRTVIYHVEDIFFFFLFVNVTDIDDNQCDETDEKFNFFIWLEFK